MSSIRYRLSAIVLVLSLFAAIAGYIAFLHEAKKAVAAQGQLERSDRIVNALRDIHADLLDMETAQRGYLLTGKVEYLDPFNRGRDVLHGHLQNLDQLLSASADDSQWLARLKALAEAKEKEMLATIDFRGAGDFDGAVSIVGSDAGKQYMDEARGLLQDRFDRHRQERQQWAQRFQTSFANAQIALGVVGLALALMLASALFSLYFGAARFRVAAGRLAQEAVYDPLTGLPNRQYLTHWMTHALAHAKREKEALAALYVGLDGLSVSGKARRRNAAALKSIAGTLKGLIRDSDFVARRDTAEFIVVVCCMTDAQLLALTKKIVSVLSVHRDGELEMPGGISVGVATADPEGDTVDGLLKRANEAMQEAKLAGKNAFCLHGAGVPA